MMTTPPPPAPRASTTQARLVLIDDHVVLREGIARAINEQPDLVVCGEAGDIAGALAVIEEQSPDLVLLDLSLDEADGMDVLRQARVRWKRLPVLILSTYDESLYAERVLRAGAMGYVMKREPTARLLEAIRTVLSGQRAVSPSVAAQMVDRFVDRNARPSDNVIARLSDREFEIFKLISEGIGPSEIARRLGISVKTIESHRESIKFKLDAKTSADLVRIAIENGLGKK